MTFVPRSYETILQEMIAHVRANTTLTDFTVGSNIRTILEACSLEDDEQYYQMVQLLDAFRIATATGADLDERAADLNVERLKAKEAFGKIMFRDGGLTKTTATINTTAGVTTIKGEDTSDFPTTYPYTIRIGEGTPQVEDVLVINNDTTFNTFTLSAVTLNAHSVGDRIAHVTGSGKTISTGVQVQTPPTTTSSPIKFITVESGVITAGNYESGLVDINAVEAGSEGVVAAGRISKFVSSPPFTGAEVTNPSATSGGRDDETDNDLRNRLLRRYDELSRGVPSAIESVVIGIEDTNTGQRIVTAKLKEDFISEDHVLYVDDGTGFIPDNTIMTKNAVNGAHSSGVTSLAVNDVSDFPSSGAVLISPRLPSIAEVVEYSAKDATTNTLSLDSATSFAHNNDDEVVLVDQVGTAEEGQNYFELDNFPLKQNSYEIYDNRDGQFKLKAEGTDYVINLTNGEIQFTGAGLSAGTIVVANYTYYTGLIQKAQKVLNGDPADSVTYPGVVAAGVIIRVDVPTIRQITVIASISVEVGFAEDDVQPEVEQAIVNYIDGLKIGDNVIIAEIIERSMGINGVYNISVQQPTSDVVILEDELPKSSDSNGNSLVTVL